MPLPTADIIMPSISSLVNTLQADFSQFQFIEGDISHWSHTKNTIFYATNDPHIEWVLLHELGHACLHHADYQRDIELLAMERDAWHHATTVLAPAYDLVIDPDFIEDHLDTYRDWLHAKSTCPCCTLTGVEVQKQQYRCLGCQHTWKTNEGTQTRVYRYSA